MLALKLRESNFKANNPVLSVDWKILVSVKKIIYDKLDVAEVTDTSKLQDDLGMDSLDGVELIMAFEDEFNIIIPDVEAEELGPNSTPIDVSRFIGTKIKLYGSSEKQT